MCEVETAVLFLLRSSLLPDQHLQRSTQEVLVKAKLNPLLLRFRCLLTPKAFD